MAHTYVILDDQDKPLRAHISIEGSDIVIHSRGGAKTGGGTNADYTAGLQTVLERLQLASVPILGAWVDSVTVQALPLTERSILTQGEGGEVPAEVLRLLTGRMKKVRADPGSQAKGGNATRRIRLRTDFQAGSSALAAIVKGEPVEGNTRSRDRLPVDVLNMASPEFVWEAMQVFLAGPVQHKFGQSTDFDLIFDDGHRFPPKAVFGMALSLALKGAPIEARHFAGGEGSPCFRLLRAAGYQVVPKDATAELPPPEENGDVGLDWLEGQKRLKAHRERERGRGLSRAKKAQFIRDHGKLICERCGVDPVAHYKSAHAESCIEVHHALIQLSAMLEGHKTKLADLQCLCANCHRLVHRLIAMEGQAGVAE